MFKYKWKHFQVPICQPDKIQCVKEITVLDEKCLNSCEGLYVTSYFKSKIGEESFSDFWVKVEDDYMKYKARKTVKFPKELKGIYILFSPFVQN